MLVLTRKENQSVVLDNEIVVTVVEIRGNSVRLAFDAPPEVAIRRAELLDRKVHPSPQPASSRPGQTDQIPVPVSSAG